MNERAGIFTLRGSWQDENRCAQDEYHPKMLSLQVCNHFDIICQLANLSTETSLF